MKRLFVLLFIVAFAGLFSANAQTQNSETVNQVLGYESTSSYVDVNLTAGDTIGIADSTWYWVLRDKAQKRLKYYVTIKLDSLNDRRDTTHVDVELWDKVSAAEDYTKRQTVTWYDGADTTISITTSSFRISEFAKIRVISQFDEFQVQIPYLFIKSVEE
jgi:hypothetical protein